MGDMPEMIWIDETTVDWYPIGDDQGNYAEDVNIFDTEDSPDVGYIRADLAAERQAAKGAEAKRLRKKMRDLAHEMRNSWGGDGWAGIQEKQWLDTVADRIEEVLTNHEQGKGDG